MYIYMCVFKTLKSLKKNKMHLGKKKKKASKKEKPLVCSP